MSHFELWICAHAVRPVTFVTEWCETRGVDVIVEDLEERRSLIRVKGLRGGQPLYEELMAELRSQPHQWRYASQIVPDSLTDPVPEAGSWGVIGRRLLPAARVNQPD